MGLVSGPDSADHWNPWLNLVVWLSVGDPEGSWHRSTCNLAEPYIWALSAMKWICYAVTIEWISLDKAAALQCSFAVLPSLWTHLFLKMTDSFFLMMKYFLPHPHHPHTSPLQKPFVNAGNEKKMEKVRNHSQEMEFWTKLGVKCGMVPQAQHGGRPSGGLLGWEKVTQEIVRGPLQCRDHCYKGWVSAEVGGLSVPGWALTSSKLDGIMSLGGGRWRFWACPPRMSGFSNLWCVNALRVRGWPGLRFIRDASFHCLETAAVVLFTISLLPVCPRGLSWAFYLVSCDSAWLRYSVKGETVNRSVMSNPLQPHRL